MKTKRSLIVIVAIIIVGAGIAVISRSARTSPLAEIPAASPQPSSVPVVSFNVEGGMFYFKPNEIRVKQGHRVKITFTNVKGMHNLVIDEFNAKSATLQASQSATVEFLADKKGTFEFYCSVANHRKQGMVGNLIVE